MYTHLVNGLCMGMQIRIDGMTRLSQNADIYLLVWKRLMVPGRNIFMSTKTMNSYRDNALRTRATQTMKVYLNSTVISKAIESERVIFLSRLNIEGKL